MMLHIFCSPSPQRCVTTLVCALLSWSAAAQTTVTADSYQLANDTQLWHHTTNAAALAYDSTANRGVARFDLSRRAGSHHFVQQGRADNNLSATFDRYQRVGKYLHGYGSFRLNMGRQFDRAWNDWYRPRYANPYTSGSSVLGNYDYQNFAFTAALGTVRLGALTYGLRLDYEVGDLSRLRDPRSRTTLLYYALTPSLTYNLGRHTLGAATSYQRRKEKLLGLTTVQADANLAYYTMTGLDQATGAVGAYNGFMRQMVWHNFGLSLSHGYTAPRYQTVSTLSLHRGNEHVEGSNKQSPGRYRTFAFAATTRHKWQTPSHLHVVTASFDRQRGRGDEYRQERVSTRDTATGATSIAWHTLLTYPHRYRYDAVAFAANYRLYLGAQRGALTYLGAGVAYDDVKQKQLLPTSTYHHSHLTATLEGGMPLWQRAAQRLRFDALASYTHQLKNAMTLANASSPYATAVWQPLHAYDAASYIHGRLAVQYEQPIRIKGESINAFVRLAAAGYSTNKHTTQHTLSLSLGVHY